MPTLKGLRVQRRAAAGTLLKQWCPLNDDAQKFKIVSAGNGNWKLTSLLSVGHP